MEVNLFHVNIQKFIALLGLIYSCSLKKKSGGAEDSGGGDYSWCGDHSGGSKNASSAYVSRGGEDAGAQETPLVPGGGVFLRRGEGEQGQGDEHDLKVQTITYS